MTYVFITNTVFIFTVDCVARIDILIRERKAATSGFYVSYNFTQYYYTRFNSFTHNYTRKPRVTKLPSVYRLTGLLFCQRTVGFLFFHTVPQNSRYTTVAYTVRDTTIVLDMSDEYVQPMKHNEK